MDQHDRVPGLFAVRKVVDQQWEVLIPKENTWLSYESEEDARIIAKGAVLEYESLERTRSGPAFADELERQAIKGWLERRFTTAFKACKLRVVLMS